ncbi:hypothetical protein [Thermanaeromonas toyohensis]|uniref:hypothetical protein n=1 Tax=Thermanaeromonas toyohensis TaxID=161154 RepID=UPI00155F6400|nr:hypothetical protein [Thermanaeromonas toyohensis]
MRAMATEELEAAIASTAKKIHELLEQIGATSDPREKRRLERRLKELPILRLWQLGQIS